MFIYVLLAAVLLHLLTLKTMSDPSEAGLKPWKPKSGEPRDPDPALAKALGIDEEEPENEADLDEEEPLEKEEKPQPTKSELEGKKKVEDFSAKIQERSEELYGLELSKSLKDSAHIGKLIHSTDPLDRKMARKILERNSDHFGASSIEAYLKKEALDGVTGDTEKKLVAQDFEIREIKQKQAEKDWSDWKKSRQVEEGSEFDQILNSIHSEHSTLPFVDALSLAKGRMGLTPTSETKGRGSTSLGGAAAPVEEELNLASPVARGLLPKSSEMKELKKFAKEYLS